MNIQKLNLSMLVALAGLVAGSGTVRAEPLDISQDPLFLVPPVQPALIMAVDNSGSMDNELLVDANDGAMWWDSNNESFTGLGPDAGGDNDIPAPGRLNFNVSGGNNNRWQKYTYVFPNGRNNNDGRTLGLGDHHAVPPLPQFAYARSPEFNAIYFNPEIEYPPWPSQGSETFTDADPTAAQADPTRGNQNDWNLTVNQFSDDRGWTFTFQEGMEIPALTTLQIKEADDNACDEVDFDDFQPVGEPIVIEDEDGCEVAVEYFPATFWLSAGNPPPADFGFTGAPIPGGRAPDGAEMLGYEIRPGNFADASDYNDAIQAFANWFQYYRKRVHLTRAAIGRSFSEVEFLRTGFFRIGQHNNNGSNVAMRNLENAGDREAFFNWQYDLRGSGGTPNKEAVDRIGELFDTNQGFDADGDAIDDNEPILEACQRNFGMLVTDGFSNQFTGAGVGNADGPTAPADEPAAFTTVLSDNESNTMADIAYHYYNTHLSAGAPNPIEGGKVPTPSACDQANPPLDLDCQEDPHMNLFGVTLGAKGLIFGRDQATVEDPFNNPPSWPTSFPRRHPNAVDDLWHAALNSRGAMFTATRPDELVEVLTSVLRDIASRIQPVGVSTSAARIDEDSLFFVADLDSSTWTGDLRAFNADDESLAWSAADEMPDHGARNILTMTDNVVREFDTGIGALDDRIFGPASPLSPGDKERIIDYLRGQRDNEEQNGGTLRDRDGPIGDIANARPTFAGPRNEGWGRLDPGYLQFLDGENETNSKANRDPIVLVGANDGMLHAFEAFERDGDGNPVPNSGGEELFAYVPSMVHDRIAELADPNYVHKFFVDGQITVADAKINESGGVDGWNTVAVGGLGAGGRGVFALDISNPDSFGTNDVLWELTPDDDPDIGHVYDEPIVTRLENGDWVAIFANGFNSENLEAHLFVVDLKTGNIKQKLELDTSDGNGLSSTAAFVDPQTRLFTSRVYAGDLKGNMWRVDFDSSGVASSFFNADPLVNVGRPIVAPPVLAPNPSGGLMVFFGTGKLIEKDDRVGSAEESPLEQFFAIRDQNSNLNNLNGLAEAEVQDTGDGRTVTREDDVDNGWRLELAVSDPSGERVLSRPQVVFGQLIFSTFEPLEDVCAPGGKRRIYVLDAVSGRGILDQRCENCGVVEVGEGAPVDPAIILRPPANPGDPGDPSDVDGDPGDLDLPGVDDVGNVGGWCSEVLMLVPGEGFVSIGTLCDGRQIWRQAR